MPEYREVLACVITINRWFRAVTNPEAPPLSLQHIWVDSTIPESRSARKGTRSSLGHTFKLNPTDNCPRGSKGSQQQVYPPFPWSKHPVKNGPPVIDSRIETSSSFEPLQSLFLRNIEATPRTVVLDLGKLFLQIQLHTHVMCQPYTRRQWDDEICETINKLREFRVAIGLDFGDYVLAFLTLDNIWTPHWASATAFLPTKHLDVYKEYKEFLSSFAEWIRRRLSLNNDGLAINVFRNANTTFGGLGVYTICEVWYMAGLPVFLSESELIRCPSRLARFCEAFWTFAQISHLDLEAFLNPYYHGFLLAATVQQRLNYRSWLHVFGKHHTRMPSRMKELWLRWTESSNALRTQGDIFERSPRLGFHDVFEPTYLQPALEKSDDLNLGALIFGQKVWETLSGRTASFQDPLSCALREYGISLDSETHLHTEAYTDQLFLPKPALKATYVDTHLFNNKEVQSQKQIWSILPNYPPNVTGPGGAQPSANLTSQPKQEKTLKWIIENTAVSAVGPLEYCAVVRPVYRQGAGKRDPLIPACMSSPILSPAYLSRQNAQKHRRAFIRTGKGKGKSADKNSNGPGGWNKSSAKSEPLHAIQASPEARHSTDVAPPAKRARISSDARLVLESRSTTENVL